MSIQRWFSKRAAARKTGLVGLEEAADLRDGVSKLVLVDADIDRAQAVNSSCNTITRVLEGCCFERSL